MKIKLPLLAFSLLLTAASPPRFAQEKAAASKIAPWVMAQTAQGGQAEFLVVLAEQADLGAAQTRASKKEKAHFVRDALWAKAVATQAPVLQWLRAHQIEHRPYYIVNLIWVKANFEVAHALAARPDVLRVEGNPRIRNLPPPLPNEEAAARPQAVAAIESGISYTGAPEVWALGYTGQGIVVAGADTGYRWEHAALKQKYAGWNGLFASHDYHWHDSIHAGGGSCGPNSPVPCDDNGHGTHTIGTAVGGDGGPNQIGMAPGAKWIGCRNMNENVGTPATYLECMEFFLAPYPVGATPAEGDPEKAPDVTVNSWTCPSSEGCSVSTLQAGVAAQRAAGLMMVVAAGNSGPNCSSVREPPSFYDEVYSVGALLDGSDTAANFSGRGRVTVDGSSRLKPDITAPGTSVRSASSASNTAYVNLAGTSMATPHVAGAVALLWSARPSLRNDVAETERILNGTAVAIPSTTCDVGEVPITPNNTYGNGRLDVKAAVAGAFLEVTALAREGAGVVVAFQAVEGATYRLQRKADLSEESWQDLSGVSDLTATSTGPAQLIHPGGANDPQASYRVVLIP